MKLTKFECFKERSKIYIIIDMTFFGEQESILSCKLD